MVPTPMAVEDSAAGPVTRVNRSGSPARLSRPLPGALAPAMA